MMVNGINTGATFADKRPLCGSLTNSQLRSGFGTTSKRPVQQHQDHDHSMKLWNPTQNKAGFFRGSLNQMSSIVLTSNSHFRVKRVGFEPTDFYVNDPDVASVCRDGNEFVVHAKVSGRTTLHAYNGRGKCNSALFIDVRPKLILPVCFLYLTDSAGRKAKGYSGAIDDIVDSINAILLPQTGICVQNRSPVSSNQSNIIQVDRDLGDKIDASILQDLDTAHDIEKQASKIAGIDCPKFIFVWKFRDQYQQGMQRLKNLFIKDGLSERRRGRVFAHELAHLLSSAEGLKKYFDQAGHTNERGHLLNEIGDGDKLTRHEVSLGMYEQAKTWSE